MERVEGLGNFGGMRNDLENRLTTSSAARRSGSTGHLVGLMLAEIVAGTDVDVGKGAVLLIGVRVVLLVAVDVVTVNRKTPR
jgi:hypothetical protein